jgi:hypothetical protein
MNNNKRKFTPVTFTSCMSPNIIDWFRSIYFSLFGSAMLSFSLKVSTLSTDSCLLFVLGVLFFLFGLFASVAIANRFKGYEKTYDTLPEDTRLSKTPEAYYYEKETDKTTVKKILVWTEHLLFWLIWIPAVISVSYAGWYIESKSATNSAETNAVISNIDTKVQQLETELQKISNSGLEKKQLQDSLDAANSKIKTQEKEIELLKKLSENKRKN